MEIYVYIIIGVLLLLIIIAAANVRIVPQANAYVIERLGAFKGIWSVGLHIKMPFFGPGSRARST